MSIRRAMLALLEQGPMYGYQLRAEFEERTGATWPLNVGQVYSTLSRLERDGLVVVDDGGVDDHQPGRGQGAPGAGAANGAASENGAVSADVNGSGERGQVSYRITDAGRSEVRAWFTTPVAREQPPRDELAIKLALAVTVPGIDVAALIQGQRTATMSALQEYTRLKRTGRAADPAAPADLAWGLVLESLVFDTEAELRWLDHCETHLRRAAARTTTAQAPMPDQGKNR